jgi:hypothetical protein
MADEAEQTARPARKPKARKLYVMAPLLTGGRAPGFRIENEQTLLQSQYALGVSTEKRALPPCSEPPRLMIDKKLGRPLHDLERWNLYWLISGGLKGVLETIDPDACEFVKCEVRLATGEAGPEFWLCNVLRILDAVDEPASRLKIVYESGRKGYNLMGGANLVFKEDVIGSAHVFRMAPLLPAIICDQQVRDACKAVGLKGIKFKDAANY